MDESRIREERPEYIVVFPWNIAEEVMQDLTYAKDWGRASSRPFRNCGSSNPVTRALISGITGHVGQELARQLLAAGVEVHGISRSRSAFRQSERTSARIHHIDGRTETLIALFEDVRPDIVFHLAALARREHLSSDVTPFINANILLGTQLLEASKVSGCRRFVSTGSYLQHDESGGYRPFNLYASTKQAFESVLAFYVDAFQFAAVVLTLCNIYSEFDPRPTLPDVTSQTHRPASPCASMPQRRGSTSFTSKTRLPRSSR